MIRKIALSSIAVAALLLGAFAATAAAQDTTPTSTPVVCTEVGYNGCIAYPDGGFAGLNPTATPTPRPQPTSSTVPSADNVDATTGSGGNAIAFTGSESRVLGYAGVGLIGFGAVALAVARRKHDNINLKLFRFSFD